jgi:hypothetical protein
MVRRGALWVWKELPTSSCSVCLNDSSTSEESMIDVSVLVQDLFYSTCTLILSLNKTNLSYEKRTKNLDPRT